MSRGTIPPENGGAVGVMPAPESGGLLLYRLRGGAPEVLLAHPGGPFWKNRDEGAWTIPKGLVEAGEDPLAAAIREFEEETGISCPAGPFVPLGKVRQRGGKVVYAWAVEGDCEPAALKSNTFQLEWPPRSGALREFPEIDRFGFFSLAEGRRKINAAQRALLEELHDKLS